MALAGELLCEKTRKDRRKDPTVTGQQPALRYRVSRSPVAEALRTPASKTRKKREPREPVMGRIDDTPWSRLAAPGEQRNTIERITPDGTGTEPYRLRTAEAEAHADR